MTYAEMAQKQSLPYEQKKIHAALRAREFYDKITGEGHNVHVSVGGLDSITLYLFLRDYVGLDVHGISVSTLEDKSIQAVHQKLGIEQIKPGMSKVEVLSTFGFPVVSKAKASKIEYLQSPDSPKQTFIHAIMTGDMGAQGGYQHSNKIKLPDKWIRLFGGYYNDHRPDLLCEVAPFPVSAKCCKHMKEDPCDSWAKEHDSFPYLGLMASEGGQREHGLTKNGCNYYGKSTTRSCPFAIFTRQDLLLLAQELNVPIPEVYGEIETLPDGTLHTTRAQRTGCTMCGFGIHIEKRPHRFDRLWRDNPEEWRFWMYSCATDKQTGEKYGWGRVLDYIGIHWTPETLEDDMAGQEKRKLSRNRG
ncbi:MAG: hypothetical protein RSD07_12725 [Angelakisella sp.]